MTSIKRDLRQILLYMDLKHLDKREKPEIYTPKLFSVEEIYKFVCCLWQTHTIYIIGATKSCAVHLAVVHIILS